ncbi:DNA-binding transcriptional LysR family regulator [Sphingobium sp. OAS761]|nr:hypothetical protein [Sphingobium sp. OAS761]MCP1469757.1 DNA-binding transcriptional LysR family regulator [Sphingobium sp. OAS761]
MNRNVAVVVPGFGDAMRIAEQSDLVALVPRSCFTIGDAGSAQMHANFASFKLPVPTPEIAISAMWHPRMDADAGHRWLRGLVVEICKQSGRDTEAA